MMKRIFLLMLVMMLICSAASATILPASGVDAEFRSWMGIECTPAVVLCQSLTVYDERGDQGGKKVTTLRYSGKTIPVIESWDGYAKIYYEDGSKTGWVHNEYLLMDPAWYLCDEGMAVYAYPDTMAPRVGYVSKGTTLPIITEYGDGSVNGWVCVSLRGAAGWLRKTAEDTVSETFFRPEMLRSIEAAGVSFAGSDDFVYRTDAAAMRTLSELLVNAEDQGGEVAGCPFTATLWLYLPDGTEVEMQLATDSCCVYRVDGRDYAYARHLVSGEEGNPDNSELFNLFSMDSRGNFAENHASANAWCFGDAPLYQSPTDTEPMAVLPASTQVLWRSTTADYAFGWIETVLNGEKVQGYVPWLSLQARDTGTEDELAIIYLQTELGWTETELEEYQMHVPMTALRNQFICVSVISRLHPQWRYDVWVDCLADGGLHDIQSPFTGAFSADESTVREILRSGTLKTANEVRSFFLEHFGPQESWSPALLEWMESECGKYPN